MKLAERARVRASGSTATSAPAWRLRLKKFLFGYKNFQLSSGSGILSATPFFCKAISVRLMQIYIRKIRKC